MSLNKKDYIDIIKTIEIIDGSIFNDQDSGIIKINIVGMKMQQQEKQISLKSIYDLVINVQDNLNNFKESTNKRFDILEKDIVQLKCDNKEIKQDIKIIDKRIDNIETHIKEIKALPTIDKELKQNKII